MIRVSRGAEPETLRLERRRRLAQAILDRRAGKDVDFSGYDKAKVDLVHALNRKCVFCEMMLQKEGSPVEHFRPKGCVQNRDDEPRDKSRYWWLAWTWENLLFACNRCNTSHKKNKFPLAPGTAPLAELSFDLDAECPLLIDPSKVDPREHIRYRWSDARNRWVPVAVSTSAIGRKTIEDLGLDEADEPTEHVAERVQHSVDGLAESIRIGNERAVRATWGRMCTSLFAPRQPFHAVTWDALDAKVPEGVRRQWGLDLPRLGKSEPPARSVAFDPADDPAGLAVLPEELQLRVRALGGYAPKAEVLHVLQLVLQVPGPSGAWTDDELAILLGRATATIQNYQRELERAAATRATKPP